MCIVISRLFGVHCLSSEIPSKICASGVWLCERLIQNIIQDMCVRCLCAGLLFVYSGISPIRCVCVGAPSKYNSRHLCVCMAVVFVYLAYWVCDGTPSKYYSGYLCVCVCLCLHGGRLCIRCVSGLLPNSIHSMCLFARVCVCVCVVVITMTQTGVVDQGGGQPTGPRARDGQKRQSRGRERDLNFE